MVYKHLTYKHSYAKQQKQDTLLYIEHDLTYKKWKKLNRKYASDCLIVMKI